MTRVASMIPIRGAVMLSLTNRNLPCTCAIKKWDFSDSCLENLPAFYTKKMGEKVACEVMKERPWLTLEPGRI